MEEEELEEEEERRRRRRRRRRRIYSREYQTRETRVTVLCEKLLFQKYICNAVYMTLQ